MHSFEKRAACFPKRFLIPCAANRTALILEPLPSPACGYTSQSCVAPPHRTFYPFGYREARQVRLVAAPWLARVSLAGSVRGSRIGSKCSLAYQSVLSSIEGVVEELHHRGGFVDGPLTNARKLGRVAESVDVHGGNIGIGRRAERVVGGLHLVGRDPVPIRVERVSVVRLREMKANASHVLAERSRGMTASAVHGFGSEDAGVIDASEAGR